MLWLTVAMERAMKRQEVILRALSGPSAGCRSPFRDFLTRGVRAHGFARLWCIDCAFERLVPFS